MYLLGNYRVRVLSVAPWIVLSAGRFPDDKNTRAGDNPIANSKATAALSATQRKVVFATSLGTVFEWYDFYLYGAMATIIARQFFSGLDEGTAYFFALLTFAAGFVVRPFGALVFGRLGDMVGRKYTFIVTILIMGLSTFIVGVVPNYASIGVAAPLILIFLRLLQGLAMGGEYGGEATDVAEHVPKVRRGADTAWIQTTATSGFGIEFAGGVGHASAAGGACFRGLGLAGSLLLSILMLGVSVYIRLNLSESTRLPADDGRSASLQGAADGVIRPARAPETAVLASPGLTAGQAVVGIAGQLDASFFRIHSLMVDPMVATIMVAISLLLWGRPFRAVWGPVRQGGGSPSSCWAAHWPPPVTFPCSPR